MLTRDKNQFRISFSVHFGKKLGSDIVVIYYLCNTCVVNLHKILQRYCAALNELYILDFDTVVNKLWRHSQQRQQVTNVIRSEIDTRNSVSFVF